MNLIVYSTKGATCAIKLENLAVIIEFFLYSDEELLDHGIWMLGNIASDNQQSRELLLGYSNITDKMINLLDAFTTPPDIKEKVIWFFVNLIKAKSIVNVYMVSVFFYHNSSLEI